MIRCFLVIFSLTGCAVTGIKGKDKNAESSIPVNHKESVMYKQAIIRCHKTGGTRIIKIQNVLRCF